MIGGLGPESTVNYYRSIIARFRALKPDAGHPHLIINSLDVDKGIALLDAGRLGELADYLTTGVELLVRAGADFGFIAANTPHLVFDEVQRHSSIPSPFNSLDLTQVGTFPDRCFHVVLFRGLRRWGQRWTSGAATQCM
jgi:aspartate/glutamate racemase